MRYEEHRIWVDTILMRSLGKPPKGVKKVGFFDSGLGIKGAEGRERRACFDLGSGIGDFGLFRQEAEGVGYIVEN